MKTLYFFLTFCIGFLICYLIFNREPSGNISVNKSPEIAFEKRVQINNEKVLSELALKKRNNLLAGQLISATKEISENKSALYNEREKIKKLQRQLMADTVNKIEPIINGQMTAHLDTLQAITDSIISGYENKLNVTQAIVAVRDSQLVICNTAYQQMQSLVNEQVARERQLSADLNTALKQQKRTRIQNRFLALGMLFVSGITTSLIIKAKQ